MGKLVDFITKQERSAVEAALERAGQQLQRKLHAQERLPQVLAALINGGQREFALEVMSAWGSGKLPPEELLEDCEKAAAVAGIALP